MTQPTLALYPEAPGFKTTGTSQEAAQAIASDAETIRARVLEVLKRHNWTADETALILGLPILSVRPRFSELRLRGLIMDSGKRRHNQSGKRAIVWTSTF